MITLIKLNEGPQRLMRKRHTRLTEYSRLRAAKIRGDKLDKKAVEQIEEFDAVNETLKDELPKLSKLSVRLMEACLKNFLQVQTSWWGVLQKKMGPYVESFPDDLQKVISDWNSDYSFSEAQVLSLGICNGALLAETGNFMNFNAPAAGTNMSSPRRPSTVNSSTKRPGSIAENSPKVSHEYSVSQLFNSPQMNRNSTSSITRQRADSTLSGRPLPDTPDVSRSELLQQVTNSATGSISQTLTKTESDSFPSLPQLTLDTPFLADVMGASSTDNNDNLTSPTAPYTGFFSSAMPMYDGPSDIEPTRMNDGNSSKEPQVLFLAASIYEFNIDRARREAGYPYLTYLAGEIFDVIGEKGELWLARNQDDATRQVGWIWNKHFAKLSS